MEIESSAESGLHIKQTNRVTFITYGGGSKPRRLEALGLNETGWPGVAARALEVVNAFPPDEIARMRVEVREDSLREALRVPIAAARGVPMDQVQIDPPPVFTPRGKVYTRP